ncbi:MAG: hypothetical protein ABJA57_04480 [Ginsengibacter sp.]
MRKTISLLMLLTSIAAELCAQSTKDKFFEVPENIVFNRHFKVDLENKNMVQINLSDISDLESLPIDSLLQMFARDITPLKDSIADPLTAKRIDYIVDVQGRKKIRLQQFPPRGASYLINKGELASLRTEQDTINIIGIILNPLKAKQKISTTNPRYYRLSFLLNDINELPGLTDMLKRKIETIRNNVNGKWPTLLGGGDHYLQKDKTITAGRPRGYTAAGTGDFITGIVFINVQNYKQYFVPSFSLGLRLTLTNRDRNFKWEPGLLWEPHYLFAKDSLNNLNTYRNDFLTIIYAQGGTRDHDPRKDFSFSAQFSLGYLIERRGEFFDKNTFRLGLGKIQVAKTVIEPSMYFSNFFRRITPGIRISQTF